MRFLSVCKSTIQFQRTVSLQYNKMGMVHSTGFFFSFCTTYKQQSIISAGVLHPVLGTMY